MSERGRPPKGRERSEFRRFVAVPTRWNDNDVYGHVNNVVYHAYIDTAVNAVLIEDCGLDIHEGEVIGLVAETGCRYHAPLAYPEVLKLGVAVERLGERSVTYAVSVFRGGAERAAADGRFVHVYVDRESRRPVALPEAMRAGLERLA